MSLEPIPPQTFTDYVAYSERKRTRWERFLDKIKPRSAAMRTTILVLLVVLFSLFMSLWFFWRTLYLPEIQQHARYLAVELELVNNLIFVFFIAIAKLTSTHGYAIGLALNMSRTPKNIQVSAIKLLPSFYQPS